MMKLTTLRLLREYVRNILNEDDYGSMALSDAAGDSPYGLHYASSSDLYKVFVKPFVDVVDVAAGKTKELSQSSQTLAAVAFETIATTLLPFMSSDYAAIFAKEKAGIAKIKQDYSDVYATSWAAFQNHDVLCAAFMYSPALFLTATFAKKAPDAAAKLLSVLSGGKFDNYLGKNASRGAKGGGVTHGGGGPVTDSINRRGNLVSETEVASPDEELTPIQKLLSNKEVKQAVASNPKTQQLQQAGQQIVQGTLKAVLAQAQGIASARSLADFEKTLGKKIPGSEKLTQVPQQERQKLEQLLVSNVKKATLELYAKELEAHVKDAINAGTPQNHPYVTDVQKAISKIRSLS